MTWAFITETVSGFELLGCFILSVMRLSFNLPGIEPLIVKVVIFVYEANAPTC